MSDLAQRDCQKSHIALAALLFSVAVKAVVWIANQDGVRGVEEKSARLPVRGKGWLANMADLLKEKVPSCGRLRDFQATKSSFISGTPPGGMFGIVAGTFGLVPTSGDETAMSHLLRPGTWFGSAPVLSTGPPVPGFQAVEPSTVLVVSLADLIAVGARFPDPCRQIGAMSERNVQVAAARIIGDLLIVSGLRRRAACAQSLSGKQ